MSQRKILLTGATGFIGGELLRRLVKQDPRAVVCLVRAPSEEEAQQRGRDTLRTLFGRDAERVASRVSWVRADIEQPHLGIAGERRASLAAEVQEVFHCAASTSFDLGLEEARKVNVVGVEGILELCEAAKAHGGFVRLHHVSTAYTAGKAPGLVDAEDLPADEPALFRNNYERTKAEAERLLRAAMPRLPISIYRPSIVVGDSTSGRTTSWNVCYYPMRLMAWGRLPWVSCGGKSLLDVVPVDYVVDGMLALSRRADTVGGTFHLASGQDAITVHDVIRETHAGMERRAGESLTLATRALGPVLWFLLTTFFRLFGSKLVKRNLESFQIYVDYTRVDTVFDTRRERALLAECGVAFPSPKESFPRAVDYALARNFGRPWPKSAERRSPVRELVESLHSASGIILAPIHNNA